MGGERRKPLLLPERARWRAGEERVSRRGEVAQLIAHADETRRRVREARRKQVREELARMEEIMAPVLEIDEATRVLIRAHLVAGGYHRRRGEWRRERST